MGVFRSRRSVRKRAIQRAQVHVARARDSGPCLRDVPAAVGTADEHGRTAAGWGKVVREPDLDRRLALPEERPRSRRIRPPLRRHLSAVMVGWTVELPPPAEVAMPTFKERRRKLARPAKTGRTRSGDAEYERRRPLATSALSIPSLARRCSHVLDRVLARGRDIAKARAVVARS